MSTDENCAMQATLENAETRGLKTASKSLLVGADRRGCGVVQVTTAPLQAGARISVQFDALVCHFSGAAHRLRPGRVPSLHGEARWEGCSSLISSACARLSVEVCVNIVSTLKIETRRIGPATPLLRLATSRPVDALRWSHYSQDVVGVVSPTDAEVQIFSNSSNWL